MGPKFGPFRPYQSSCQIRPACLFAPERPPKVETFTFSISSLLCRFWSKCLRVSTTDGALGSLRASTCRNPGPGRASCPHMVYTGCNSTGQYRWVGQNGHQDWGCFLTVLLFCAFNRLVSFDRCSRPPTSISHIAGSEHSCANESGGTKVSFRWGAKLHAGRKNSPASLAVMVPVGDGSLAGLVAGGDARALVRPAAVLEAQLSEPFDAISLGKVSVVTGW